MFHVTNSVAIGPAKLWSDGAARLEAVITDWYRLLEPELSPGVNCNLSVWSNDHYLLAAVASFSVAGNSELVLEVGIHRNQAIDRTATFRAELCRECGSEIATMTAPPLELDKSATIPAVEMSTHFIELRLFLRDQSPCVLRHLTEMKSASLPLPTARSQTFDTMVTRP